MGELCGGSGGGYLVSRNQKGESVEKMGFLVLICCVSLLLFCASSEEKTLYSVV